MGAPLPDCFKREGWDAYSSSRRRRAALGIGLRVVLTRDYKYVALVSLQTRADQILVWANSSTAPPTPPSLGSPVDPAGSQTVTERTVITERTSLHDDDDVLYRTCWRVLPMRHRHLY